MIQCAREEALQILWFCSFEYIQLMGHTFLICPFLRGSVNCGREAIMVLWCHITKLSCIKSKARCMDSDHSHEGSVRPKETYTSAQFHFTNFWAKGFGGLFFLKGIKTSYAVEQCMIQWTKCSCRVWGDMLAWELNCWNFWLSIFFLQKVVY